MAGGLLNLVSEGNQNVFLTGNPSKTFFKSVYKKYTNFGLQTLRIDYSGQRYLNLETDSVFSFKIPRYAELLMDTYLVINLPDIWSPIYNLTPDDENNQDENSPKKYSGVPYEFKWIRNLGTLMIREITISSGGHTLQKMSGDYLYALKQRDYNESKKELHDRMTGNTVDMYDPANAENNCGRYPNALNWDSEPAEPSIRGRKLYIPIDSWFSMTSKMAFPLISMQYNELIIDIRLRPIKELFTIRDVTNGTENYPYIQPNFNNSENAFYRFIQTPVPQINEQGQKIEEDFQDKNVEWNTDIHLMANYAFLTDDEAKQFAAHEQKYLIKEIHEYKFDNITGSKKVKLDTLGIVANWMFKFQRSDISERNEWTNFSNWAYDTRPYKNIKTPSLGKIGDEIAFYTQPDVVNDTNIATNTINNLYLDENFQKNIKVDCGCNCDNYIQQLYNSGPLKIENSKEILSNMAILFDGQYREENLDAGVFNYIQKYNRTMGNAKDGLYCYNFCLSTNPYDTQPSGAINMSKFEKIELEINTIDPPRDANAQVTVICDDDGDPIGVRQPTWDIYKFNYDLTIFEERYNIVHFIGGNCGLTFSR